jgi:hypothetical protein
METSYITIIGTAIRTMLYGSCPGVRAAARTVLRIMACFLYLFRSGASTSSSFAATYVAAGNSKTIPKARRNLVTKGR